MATLLSGAEAVSLNKLLPNGKDESVTTLVRSIARRAQANAEEKGLQTLFVALGMATWVAEDGGRPADSPVLLFPVTLETKGSQSVMVRRIGDVQFNQVLSHVLETQFGVSLNYEELLSRCLADDDGEKFDLDPLYCQLRKIAAEVPGFDVKSAAVLGNFAFQKMAMVKDLQERANELAAHDIVAAIAGDNEARNAVGASDVNVDPSELDRIPPDNEFVVLDADSSQQCAIGSVTAGQNAVIHGPPGTGKSQTIANLIASLAAQGQRVLFVAEKRAALEVVLRRLDQIGLGYLAIDLHGADVSPKQVMREVAATLEKVRNAVPPEAERLHKQLVDRRARLNSHVLRLHTKRDPTKLSVYEMQGKLLRIDKAAKSETRWHGDKLNHLNPEIAGQVQDLLGEASDFDSLFLRTDPSAWTGARLRDGAAVQNALKLVSHANKESYAGFAESLANLTQQSGLLWPGSMTESRQLMSLLAEVGATLRLYDTGIYCQDLQSLLGTLAPGGSGRLADAWTWLMNSAYRNARKLVRSLRTAGQAPVAALLTELAQAREQLHQWRQRSTSGSLPCQISDFTDHETVLSAMFSDTSALSALFPDKAIEGLSIDDFGAFLSALASDNTTPQQLPKLLQIEDALQQNGQTNLVNEIRTKRYDSLLWPEVFQYAWLSSTLEAASENDPELLGFKGTTHNRYVSDFDRLDEERIKIAAERVRRAHGLRAIEAMNAYPDQQHLIKAEALKVRKHLPLRKVFAQAAEVLTAVCPCWMASPLSVSQLLDGGKQYFDFVVFDEASQILPEDAVPAILRGKKLVVAGDNRQLPPTTFFAASDDEEYSADEEAGASEGFESLLDMMIPFVKSCYLDWHYRSRDETLINFSNHYIYQGRLVTFPGPGGPPAISHELVLQELGVDGEEESCAPEVRRVVELVIRHAQESPNETLGVITMGIKHMNRVQAALDRELQKYPELEPFFDSNLQERFFVKNLERVQGDERDVIIISIGYGKDRGGNVPLRFGPLLSEGGRRRLNVAITRARQKLTLVSSFSHTDVDPARIRPGSGVELLRDYLQYASSKGKRLGDGQLTSVPLNDFEADVFDALELQGLKLIPQLGASKFRIDMVAEHPKKPGRFVLAIECDGASYHSSYTARDRDRLRQQQLENLGWRFHRIWSTDWFLRKEDEIGRAVKSFESAVEYADKLDGGIIRNREPRDVCDPKSNTSKTDKPAKITRDPKPHIPLRQSIGEYHPSELVELIDWISSDGQLRTDDEILTEMVSALGFSRRGVRIDEAVSNAIRIFRTNSK